VAAAAARPWSRGGCGNDLTAASMLGGRVAPTILQNPSKSCSSDGLQWRARLARPGTGFQRCVNDSGLRKPSIEWNVPRLKGALIHAGLRGSTFCTGGPIQA